MDDPNPLMINKITMYNVHRLNLLAKTLDFYKTCKTYIHVETNIK